MQINNRIFNSRILLLIFIVSPFSLFCRQSDSWWDSGKNMWNAGKNVGVAGLVAGGIMGGIGVAMMAADAVSNWMSPSNATILNESIHYFDQHFLYKTVVIKLRDSYQIYGISLADCPWIRTQLNEQLLYEIGITLWNEGHNLVTYIWDLKKYVQDLQYHQNRLKKRITQLKTDGRLDFQTKNDLHNMQTLSNEIAILMDDLLALYHYLNHHIAYFEMSQKEWSLCKEYEAELTHIRQANGKYDSFSALVYLIRSYYPNDLYPSIPYVQRLEKHISQIIYAKNQANYHYVDRFAWIDVLVHDLTYIRQIIDVWYRDELILYERTRFEKEKAQLERERINILKAQTRAIEDQTNALALNNQLHISRLLHEEKPSDQLSITVRI